MAACAVLRGKIVKNDALSIHHTRAGVALVARYLFVRALQREIRLCFMIELGRLPLLGIVAVVACLRPAEFDELAGMWVLMAAGTDRGRRFERCFGERAGSFIRFVAFLAGQFRMRANQREFCRRMIKAGQIGPRFDRMACQASCRMAIGIELSHLRAEPLAVGVLVATGARESMEMIRDDFRPVRGQLGGMAFEAGNGEMRAL